MDINIRRDDQLLFGRLVAMPSTNSLYALKNAQGGQGYANTISVDFPAMPDVLELARSADYVVNYAPNMPDGIHQYKGTKPMELPLSFKLHFMDSQYCKEGGLTLLKLAARLHSFILPVSTFNRGVTVAPVAGTSSDLTGKATDPSSQSAASQEQVYSVQRTSSDTNGMITSPVTCWLNLIWIAQGSVGISCIGYVKDVKVVFGGPWNRGPSSSFNVPTSAEYSFTFVHNPGYGNSQNISTSNFPTTVSETPQTYADDVKGLLYNTRSLVYAANYQGFGQGNDTQSPYE